MEIIATESGSSLKFVDPEFTANGDARAQVALDQLQTLWLNTGTLCNLTCQSCYIESSPSNDRLTYLSRSEVQAYLAEIAQHQFPVTNIGITGGEPFMNPDLLNIMADCLDAGMQVLLLTNAMRPMMKCADGLLALQQRYPSQIQIRVSIDLYNPTLHEQERGKRSWQPMIHGLSWLADNGFDLSVAARTRWGDSEQHMRKGFAELFSTLKLSLDAADTRVLTLFPEMDTDAEVPEISSNCWGILGVDPKSMMCASARMVVKHKHAATPSVVACTLLPYEPDFTYAATLAESLTPVVLNHRHCAKFCVLGGGSCSD